MFALMAAIKALTIEPRVAEGGGAVLEELLWCSEELRSDSYMVALVRQLSDQIEHEIITRSTLIADTLSGISEQLSRADS